MEMRHTSFRQYPTSRKGGLDTATSGKGWYYPYLYNAFRSFTLNVLSLVSITCKQKRTAKRSRGHCDTCCRSNVRDIQMRMGMWPPCLRVVRRGLSSLTVCPPTITASDLALFSKTCCRERELLTQAEWPVLVAILPSSVMAYLKMPSGCCLAALCSSACHVQAQVSPTHPFTPP